MESDIIISSVPASYQKTADRLLRKIKGLGTVTWDHNGELTVKGTRVAGSNISDIVNDGARARKKAISPLGWQKVANELKEGGITTGIGNQAWLEYSKKEEEEDTKSVAKKSSPQTGSGKRRWESWP